MSIGCDFRGGCFAIADPLDGLAANHDFRELFVRKSGNAALKLFR